MTIRQLHDPGASSMDERQRERERGKRERGKREGERGKRERFKVSVTSPLTKHESTLVRSNDAWLIRTLKFEKQREVNYQ